MKTSSNLYNVLVVIVAACPLLYLALSWNSVPENVTLQYDFNLQPDKTGHKYIIWLPAGLVAVVSVLIFFLLQYIHHFDPKMKNTPPSSAFSRLALVVLLFMTALNFIIIRSAIKNTGLQERTIFPLLGLLFAFLGNYMNNIKPNYFAGFRLPWTLSNDYNWRKTHQLAGKIWFWGGLLMAVITFLIPLGSILPVLIIIMLVLILIPSVYSYRLFRQGNEGRKQ